MWAAESSGQTHITVNNSNPHPLLRVTHAHVTPCKGMDIWFGGWGWGVGGNMMRSPQGALSARKGRLKAVMCPAEEVTHKWTSHGPTAGEGYPTAAIGVSAWKHLANGEGRCPPLCRCDTEQ